MSPQSTISFSWSIQEGVDPKFGVVNVENMEAQSIYNKTLEWVKETYRYPEKVIKSSTPNQRIRIEVSENIGEVKKVRFPYLITIEFSFKDGKFKYEPLGTQNPATQREFPEMDINLMNFPTNIPEDGLKYGMMKLKKDKVIENTSKTMDNLILFLNSSVSNLTNYFQKKDEW